ncbi:MAG: DUF393 domain-containing protein [Jatrophihabitantaceae bacterium]
MVTSRRRPVLVYDGDCAFCTKSVRLAEHLRADADVIAWQFADLAALGLTEAQANDSVQWVDPAGRISSGHEAIAALLIRARFPFPVLGTLMRTPPVSWLARRVYAWVAANRHRLPGGTPACSLPPEQRPGAPV